MDMWNGQRTSVVNQMPTSVQEDDDHHSIQTIQQTSHASATNDRKKNLRQNGRVSRAHS
jgi:hypothetical protein